MRNPWQNLDVHKTFDPRGILAPPPPPWLTRCLSAMLSCTSSSNVLVSTYVNIYIWWIYTSGVLFSSTWDSFSSSRHLWPLHHRVLQFDQHRGPVHSSVPLGPNFTSVCWYKVMFTSSSSPSWTNMDVVHDTWSFLPLHSLWHLCFVLQGYQKKNPHNEVQITLVSCHSFLFLICCVTLLLEERSPGFPSLWSGTSTVSKQIFEVP